MIKVESIYEGDGAFLINPREVEYLYSLEDASQKIRDDIATRAKNLDSTLKSTTYNGTVLHLREYSSGPFTSSSGSFMTSTSYADVVTAIRTWEKNHNGGATVFVEIDSYTKEGTVRKELVNTMAVNSFHPIESTKLLQALKEEANLPPVTVKKFQDEIKTVVEFAEGQTVTSTTIDEIWNTLN